jgi:hypothetical protein
MFTKEQILGKFLAALRKDVANPFPEYKEALPELKDHPIFSGAQSVGFISGESPKWLHKLPLSQQDQVKQYGHQMLGSELRNMGLKHQETEGRYGSPEKSYIVYGASKDQLHHLANKLGQDSYIHIPSGHKTARMYYSDLAEDENGNSLKGSYIPSLGTYAYHPSQQPEDFYTKLPGKGYMRLNFNWDKPPINETAMKEVTKKEVIDLLLQALRKSIGRAVR